MTSRVHAHPRMADDEVRVHALAAAATVMAGRIGRPDVMRGVTLALAVEFARYIRTGSVELSHDTEEGR